jgi:hypothetical protein
VTGVIVAERLCQWIHRLDLRLIPLAATGASQAVLLCPRLINIMGDAGVALGKDSPPSSRILKVDLDKLAP